MFILGLETTTENVSVGLVNDQGPAWEVNRFCHYTLVRELMGMINELCQQAQTGISGVDHLAVSIGPGSFTGLRIGLAAAQGIAFSLHKPLIPVPTLDSLASQVLDPILPIAVLQKARKGEAYFALFQKKYGVLKKVVPEKVVLIDSISGELKSPTILIGNAISIYQETLVRQLQAKAIIPPVETVRLSGKVIAQCGLANLGKNVPPDAIEPLYIKEPDAKLKEKSAHV